jgi:GNAT superfamily N-acetyltransferase
VAGAVAAQGLVHLDWVATLPGERGRGVGAALTAAAAGSCPRLPAVLLASDAGRPVYHRLGFFDILRSTIWEAP